MANNLDKLQIKSQELNTDVASQINTMRFNMWQISSGLEQMKLSGVVNEAGILTDLAMDSYDALEKLTSAYNEACEVHGLNEA